MTFLFILILFQGIWFDHYLEGVHTVNEYIRYYSIQALADYNSLDVDKVFDRYYPSWRKIGKAPNIDAAFYKGHFYPDKAPGLTFVGIPVYFLFSTLFDTYKYAHIAVYFLTLLLITIPALLFVYFVSRHSKFPDTNFFVFFAGTPVLIYSTLFMGELFAGLLIAASFYLIKNRKNYFIAGLLAGWGGISDYLSTIIVIFIIIYFVVDNYKNKKNILFFLSGFILPVLLHLIYNYLMFDSFFDIAYKHKYFKKFKKIHEHGLFGLTLPSLYRLYGILLSPERGLFFLSPVLVLIFSGLKSFRKEGQTREFWLFTAIITAFPLVVSMFIDWKAGNSAGPRHLVSMIPLLIFPFTKGMDTLLAMDVKPFVSIAIGLLFLISLMHVFVVFSTFPYSSTLLKNPIYHENIPLFFSGCFYYPIFLKLPHVLIDIVGYGLAILVFVLGITLSRMKFFVFIFYIIISILLFTIGVNSRKESLYMLKELKKDSAIKECSVHNSFMPKDKLRRFHKLRK